MFDIDAYLSQNPQAAQQQQTNPLMSALLQRSGATMGPPGPAAPTDPSGPMTSPVNSPAPTNDPGAPITIQGDTWKPTHRNILGKIADALSGKPIYENRMLQKDMTEAMQGFNENPQQAIRRIAQIPGQAGTAYKMWEQLSQDKEKDESRDIRDSAKEDMMYTRLGSMAGAATPENWDAMRTQMVNYVKRWKKDPDDYNIPQSYDQNWLDAMSNGSITAAKQKQLETQKENQTLNDWYKHQRVGQIDQHEQDSNSHFQQNQNRMVGNHQDVMNNRPQSVMTKYGPGITSKDGTQMIVHNGGRVYGYIKGGRTPDGKTNWIPQGDVTDQFHK